MKAKTVAYGALAAAGSILMASLPAQGAELAPVTVGAVGAGSANQWPVYIAMAKGFFKDDGLAVSVIDIPTSSSVQQQLAAGSINIGSGGIVDPLRAIDEGAPITLLRIQVGNAPYYMYAKPSIHSLAQLKHKTVMLGQVRDITKYYFDRMVEGEGLPPGSYSLVYAGSTSARLAALLSGSVDATMLNPPFVFLAQAQGFRELPVRPGFDKGLPFSAFAVNLNWGESHKPLIRKFLDAYGKGVAWFYDTAHRTEAVNILLKQVNVPSSEAEKNYDMYVAGKFFVLKTTIVKSDLQNEIDVIKKDGSISGSTDFSRFYKPALLGLSK
jgi:NitT/TauT family transport system substrate-binding protein